ncbi:hypothetical protein E2C01_086036 [Portunus trituberculatus]|uniref:Uncharacterized protein n=1 Tax=Portunus trituberculatus TaxID=210409 RepID=A0A5B7JAG4_PORTR|nr:hypothetical protein [Portunus trituberculatus]
MGHCAKNVYLGTSTPSQSALPKGGWEYSLTYTANHSYLWAQWRLLPKSCTHAYYQPIEQEHLTLSQVDTAIAATFVACLSMRALCL